VPPAKKSALISDMDDGDDRCLEDSARFVVRIPFDLRANLKGELIDLDKDWHKYLPGGTIRFH
jgi:hypothetical protein